MAFDACNSDVALEPSGASRFDVSGVDLLRVLPMLYFGDVIDAETFPSVCVFLPRWISL
jgi:hypothetical protein